MFSSATEMTQLTVDRLDDGYENVKNICPKLQELFHFEFDGSNLNFQELKAKLMVQNVAFGVKNKSEKLSEII